MGGGDGDRNILFCLLTTLFFFFCLSLIIHSYTGVQDSVLVSSHATYYLQGISFTSILPKEDSQVLNSLLGSVSLLPTSHWVSVLEQPTDSSNSTPAKICELPFLSVHSVFPVVTGNDANLPRIQARILFSPIPICPQLHPVPRVLSPLPLHFPSPLSLSLL